MAITRTLADIPTAAKAAKIEKQYWDAGAITVTKTKQTNGKYTVTGTFPG